MSVRHHRRCDAEPTRAPLSLTHSEPALRGALQLSPQLITVQDRGRRDRIQLRCTQDSVYVSAGPTHQQRLSDSAAQQKLCRQEGIEIQGTRKGGPGSQLRIYFWDPEENLIELFWAMDQIGWDGVTREYAPVEEIDLESFDIEAWIRAKGSAFTYVAVNHPVED